MHKYWQHAIVKEQAGLLWDACFMESPYKSNLKIQIKFWKYSLIS